MRTTEDTYFAWGGGDGGAGLGVGDAKGRARADDAAAVELNSVAPVVLSSSRTELVRAWVASNGDGPCRESAVRAPLATYSVIPGRKKWRVIFYTFFKGEVPRALGWERTPWRFLKKAADVVTSVWASTDCGRPSTS